MNDFNSFAALDQFVYLTDQFTEKTTLSEIENAIEVFNSIWVNAFQHGLWDDQSFGITGKNLSIRLLDRSSSLSFENLSFEVMSDTETNDFIEWDLNEFWGILPYSLDMHKLRKIEAGFVKCYELYIKTDYTQEDQKVSNRLGN
jgi:hypothetical protein